MDSKKTIEDIILMDSHRGMDELRPYLPEFYCEEAAKAILSWRRGPVLLATGFYVAGHAETDGPTGTVVLAKALQKLGFEPHILTDEACSHYFEPEGLDVIYVDIADGEPFAQDLLQKLQYGTMPHHAEITQGRMRCRRGSGCCSESPACCRGRYCGSRCTRT